MKSLDNTYYIALSFHIPKPKLNAYHEYLNTHVIPVYIRNMNESITTYNIYTHKLTTEKHGEFPLWTCYTLYNFKIMIWLHLS